MPNGHICPHCHRPVKLGSCCSTVELLSEALKEIKKHQEDIEQKGTEWDIAERALNNT